MLLEGHWYSGKCMTFGINHWGAVGILVNLSEPQFLIHGNNGNNTNTPHSGWDEDHGSYIICLLKMNQQSLPYDEVIGTRFTLPL